MVQVCNPIVFTECATRLDQPCIMDSVILSTSDVECIDGWRPWYVELTNHDGFCRAAMSGCRLVIKRIRRLTSNCCLQIPALPPHAPSGIHPSSVHLTAPVCLFACLPAYLHACRFLLASAFRFLLPPLCTCLDEPRQTSDEQRRFRHWSPTQLPFLPLLLRHIDSGKQKGSKDCLRQGPSFRRG